eukprot:444942-Amorphochlora_amoeboformis.AAC.1
MAKLSPPALNIEYFKKNSLRKSEDDSSEVEDYTTNPPGDSQTSLGDSRGAATGESLRDPGRPVGGLRRPDESGSRRMQEEML